MTLIEVLSRFESLGNNCEFGIVQRSAGYDPPGLFRNVGFLDVEQIISAVSHNLEGMFEPGRYELTAPEGWLDWASRLPGVRLYVPHRRCPDGPARHAGLAQGHG